jgi:uncharacterized protein YbgA (DUF1722 family)
VNPAERENMTGILLWVTGWNKSALESLNDEELEKLYNERVDRG